MLNRLKESVKKLIPSWLWKIRKEYQKQKQFRQWERDGRRLPPVHAVKQRAIDFYRDKYKIPTLIETGTFMGHMVEAQKFYFRKIYSIELSEELFLKAQNRFASEKHVQILQGDSGKVLPKLVTQIKSPAIFWLDGHYSAGETARGDKDCPIFEELEAIFSAKTPCHIILIDDARYFVGKGDYPTIDELIAFIADKGVDYESTVENDIIRFVPAELKV